MFYILDSLGYIEATSSHYIERDNKTCTEYKGSIPSGYETLDDWVLNANIRAYKIDTSGNLVFDSAREAALQEEYANNYVDNQIYSGDEVKIGTWYNGKPLYRKVIAGGLADTAGDTIIDLSSLNINYITRMEGTVGTNFDYKPINFYLEGNYISTRYAYGKLYLAATSAYVNLPFTLIIEYTKTTD